MDNENQNQFGQQDNSGIQNSFSQPEPLGPQESFTPAPAPAPQDNFGTQNSFSQPAGDMGGQSGFGQPQDSFGGQSSFSQLQNDFGGQNNFTQPQGSFGGAQGGFQQNAYQPQPYQQPAAFQQPYQQPVGETPVGLGDWVLSVFLSFIPCVNIIMLLIWSFGSSTPKSKSNWAKAVLIWKVVKWVVSIVVSLVWGSVLLSIIEDLGYYY